jgi:CheY-like chemotaxis protein/anti-sigma regulatory factor (Ser/Thr protein kinase)
VSIPTITLPREVCAAGIPSRLTGETSVLIADDSLVDRRIAGRLVEKHPGWRAVFAGNGAEALAAIERQPPRVVLTDLQMPVMDGLALVQAVREKFPHVPVILMTRSGSEELAVRALRTGAASYVPKASLASHLVPALEQVLSASQLDVERRKMLSCLTQRDSRFSLENDPGLVPPLVALLQEDLLALRLCDATGATRVGVALQEALENAIYHGNLELHPREGTKGEALHRIAHERRQLAPYRDRRVRLFANVSRAEAVYVIIDQGPGFDHRALPEPDDNMPLDQATGRGVLLMRAFMDRVSYSPTGNQVTLVKHRDAPAA